MTSKKPKFLSTPESQKQFEIRIQELLDRVQRLKTLHAKGYVYSEVWVSGTTVKQHHRKGHWTTRPTRKR